MVFEDDIEKQNELFAKIDLTKKEDNILYEENHENLKRILVLRNFAKLYLMKHVEMCQFDRFYDYMN